MRQRQIQVDKMSNQTPRCIARTIVAAVALTTAMSIGACATADTRYSTNASLWGPGQADGNVVRVSGKRPLNLLSAGNKRKKARSAKAKLGRGNYICSASGFGQKSRCRRN